MKTIKQLLITLAVLLCSATASAYDFEVDGIYYNILSMSDLTVEVTSGDKNYSGEVIIPSDVTYKSKTLTVTSIGEAAFSDCRGLTSVTIGNSVTSIGNYAFFNCTSLKDLRIEDGETTLSLGYNSFNYSGEGLFYDCPLESLYLGRNIQYETDTKYGYSPFYGKTSLKSVTIGNSVTSIGDYAFYYCTGLTSVKIPNSVTSIGDYAFYYCDGLTSVTIGNSVTSIGYGAFYGCIGLTSVTIGNSVTSIGGGAFYGCIGLTSVTIGNSVTSIGYGAFYGCEGLTSVTIGNSVTSIGDYAFYGCEGLTSIYLLGKTPPTVGISSFTNKQYVNTRLYVPQGSLATYQSADTWKEFWDIQEFDATEKPEDDVKKCATPVITYNDSGLDIASETDGSEIHTDITCSDANSYNGDRIDLSATYSITTYATKSGYLNSDTATATLCWIAVSGSSEENSIIEVEAMPVLITCNNGTINISGGKEGAEVVVYTTSGVAVGNATITNGNASISTELAMGEIVVVNIAGKGIKIVMQ